MADWWLTVGCVGWKDVEWLIGGSLWDVMDGRILNG